LSPPVFLAGTFTQWQPSLEMDHETVVESNGHAQVFYKAVELKAGEHQYKFRLGHGDWWIVDGSSETGTWYDTMCSWM